MEKSPIDQIITNEELFESDYIATRESANAMRLNFS